VVLFVDYLEVVFLVNDWARQDVSHQLLPLLVVRFEGTIEEICCLVAVPAALAALAAVGCCSPRATPGTAQESRLLRGTT